MRHDRDPRAGLTVVEIVLMIALIILPVTLVLILFGKDIKRWVGSTFGSAKSESTQLYRDRSGKAMGSVKGQVGAAGTGSGSQDSGGGDSGSAGTGSGTGSDSGGRAAAPVQSTSKASTGGGVGGSNHIDEPENGKPMNIPLVGIAVVVALVVAVAMTRRG